MTREPMLSPQDLADWFDVPVATVYRWNSQGTGPTPRRLGKHIRYLQSDCLEWLESRTLLDVEDET